MATPTSRTVPSSPIPSSQGSPRTRDWSKLKTGEPGSAFRGIGRGKGSRGGSTRGGRGATRPRANSGQKSGNQADTASSTPSPSPKAPSVSRKPPVPTSANATTNNAQGKVVNGSVERSRPQPDSHKHSRAVPAVVVAPASPSRASQTAPPTPPRSANRQRRSQPGKGITTTSKPPPPPHAIKTQKTRGGVTPASQILRKDVPPHLAAAHEAEVRHDVDVLVERVRAVAMAENRPTTPGSHIDWAGDEDDSLPDLDDWGVLTAYNYVTPDEDQSKEISPILADALKPLPEPNSEVYQEDRETETCDAQSEQVEVSPIQPSFLSSSMEGAIGVSSTKEVPEQCSIVPEVVEELSSPIHPDGKLPLHPSLPSQPVTATESLRARGGSVGNHSNLLSKPPPSAEEEVSTTKTEGLSESIHALSPYERLALERASSAPSSERSLAASIHAPVSGLPESHSAPSLLPLHTSSTIPRTHSRSQTEGRPVIQQPNTASPGTTSHRRGRSGVSSPLGRHVCTHARNQSTPARAGTSRSPQASRPVITGEAISRLARTIGGLGPTTRTQAIPVSKDSTVSSDLRLTS